MTLSLAMNRAINESKSKYLKNDDTVGQYDGN